jgi:hypothetical protein
VAIVTAPRPTQDRRKQVRFALNCAAQLGALDCDTLQLLPGVGSEVQLEIIRRGEPYDHPPLASLSTASWAGRGSGIARCCALAVKGEVIAAPPNSVMNSRRFIQFLVMLRGWNDQAGQ